MTTESKEASLQYEVCMRDLAEAREALAQRNKYVLSAPKTKDVDLDLIFLDKFLCEIAVVKYARPFKASRWGNEKFYISAKEFVPDQYKTLHDEIITVRDQVVAHSDGGAQVPFHIPGIETKFIGTKLEAQIILNQKNEEFLELITTIHNKLEAKIKEVQGNGGV